MDGTTSTREPPPEGPPPAAAAAIEEISVTGRAALVRDMAFRFPIRYRVVWIALTAIVVLCLIAAPAVFHTDSISLVFALAGVLAIASTGQLLVVMSGGIDLSVPAVMTFAGAIVVSQSNSQDGNLAGAIVVAIVISLLIGLINGLLVAVAKLNALIVTLAMAGVILGVSLLWVGANYSSTGTVPPSLGNFANRNAGPVSVIAFVGLGVVLVVGLMLRSTRVGRAYVASGTSPTAARIIGVRVVLHQVSGYVIAAGLYGIAGLLLAGLLRNPNDSLGDPYQLQTIVAVALGGAVLGGGPASVAGTLAACLFLGFVTQFMTVKGYSGGVNELVNGSLLLLAVMLVTAGARGFAALRVLPGRRRSPRRTGAAL
jgi:ribose transport system permease protein